MEREPSSLFGDVVQPDALSLFSSTSSDPFALWALHPDPDLKEDSGICLVQDTTNELASSELGAASGTFQLRTDGTLKGSCSEPVLHIQSPAIRSTFVRSPPSDDIDLGITLSYITFQFKAMGSSKPLLFEIGLRDEHARRGRLRISSFQAEPKLYLSPSTSGSANPIEDQPGSNAVEPILHLPLQMAARPDTDETSFTAWQVVSLPLDRIAQHFSDGLFVANAEKDSIPKSEIFGRFHSISYVKVYANLRLRRVWCSRHLPDHDLSEFQVFA